MKFAGIRIVTIYLPLVVLLGGGCTAFWYYSRQTDRFPLRTVEVRSELKYVREDDVKKVTLPYLEKGFFGIDAKALHEALTVLPWVEAVTIRRAWPDRLVLSVEEQVGQARWGDKGVLTTEGSIFYPDVKTIPGYLPQFTGPEARAKEMLVNYLTFLELLAPVGLSIQSLEVSNGGGWRAVLDNGITLILGRAGFSESIHRFVLAYQASLQAKRQGIAYVDLRYTNGVAVGWK